MRFAWKKGPKGVPKGPKWPKIGASGQKIKQVGLRILEKTYQKNDVFGRFSLKQNAKKFHQFTFHFFFLSLEKASQGPQMAPKMTQNGPWAS